MQIFLDTADVTDIRRWLAQRVVDGVTTNPSIIASEGVTDVEERVKEIAGLIHPRPLSVEVTTDETTEMLDQGRKYAQWASNIVVKIPVITAAGAPCLDVVRTLEDEGTRVNVTACLSFGQAALAAKAGASYVSLFAGRVADEGHDASALITMTVNWIRRWQYKALVIVGSIREAINLQDAAVAGADVITIPPKFLAKWVDHMYSRETVRGFLADARRVAVRI